MLRRILLLLGAERVPPLAQHCLLSVPTAVLPSIAFVCIARGLAALAGMDVDRLELGPDRRATLGEFFGTVVFAPITETLILAGVIYLLSLLTSRKLLIASASAVLWGGSHSLFSWFWFFGTFWSFYVFSCSYMAWRAVSFRHAFSVACVPHALINLFAMSLVLFSGD